MEMESDQRVKRHAFPRCGQARKLLHLFNPMRPKKFLKRVMLYAEWRCFTLLACIHISVRAIVSGLTCHGILPHRKLLNQDDATHLRLDALGASVWGLQRGIRVLQR